MAGAGCFFFKEALGEASASLDVWNEVDEDAQFQARKKAEQLQEHHEDVSERSFTWNEVDEEAQFETRKKVVQLHHEDASELHDDFNWDDEVIPNKHRDHDQDSIKQDEDEVEDEWRRRQQQKINRCRLMMM